MEAAVPPRLEEVGAAALGLAAVVVPLGALGAEAVAQAGTLGMEAVVPGTAVVPPLGMEAVVPVTVQRLFCIRVSSSRFDPARIVI